MNKLRITLEIETRRRNKQSTSQLDKLTNAFIRLWKATLKSNLHPSNKIKLLRQIIITSTLLSLIYLLLIAMTFALNHP